MPALIILAILILAGSWLGVSNATSGVAGICTGCFFLILARMRQAEVQHTHLLEMLTVITRPLPPAPPPPKDSPRAPSEPVTDANVGEMAKRLGVTERA
jgi:hypothetical protein